MNKVHYNVSGIFNTPMKTQMKNSLTEIDGVGQINIDLIRSTVEVDYNPPANPEDIKNCIEHIGCKVTGTVAQ